MVLGGLLVVAVRSPAPPRPPSERGHRLFPVAADAVRGLDLVLDGRRLGALRAADGWSIDGRPATRTTAAALDDLVGTLVGLRAVDVFRARDGASYGLERPHATVILATERGRQALEIGDANAAASAFYARRAGDPRVLVVGALLFSELERVFANREREAGS